MANYFDFKTARRYFHFVAFKFDNKFSPNSYWKDAGVQLVKDSQYVVETDFFKIERQSIISSTPYYNGGQDYSIAGDGEAPFSYDLIALYVKASNILVIGFPFKQLAKQIVSYLIEKRKYLSKASFVKPNLDKLIRQNNSNDFEYEYHSCHFSSLGLTLTGDKNITAINLGGDRPLDSPIYKTLFKDVIQKKQAIMENCSIRCEVIKHDEDDIPRTRGNVHLDHFGNLKIYIHGSGKNVFVIPYIFFLLDEFKCFDTSFVNPLLHLKDE